eukprot:TRINITY_DN13023_c0_g1_i1.p1 TRINITY_DN13023_c0_g1~~TRINITY_DN13023_c0_g1_i1.p1  ORF type:complete len:899 (+),score=120.56 TRINITY_DN13023_c0_g1_i1:67-2763(+)
MAAVPAAALLPPVVQPLPPGFSAPPGRQGSAPLRLGAFDIIDWSWNPGGENQRARSRGARAFLLRHRRSGLHCVLSPDAAGRDSAAALCARTPPGGGAIAHCLEHCVLHGSSSYPHDDAWAQLAGRCFLSSAEAVTSPAATTFTVASPLPCEVARALPVVADLFFRPILSDEAIQTECSRGRRAGVVFHEQLGAVRQRSDAHSVWVQRGLLHPALARPVGGTPGAVARVTPRAVREVHRRYYRPGNSLAVLHAPTPAGAGVMLRALDAALQRSAPGPQPGAAPAPRSQPVSRLRRGTAVAAVTLPREHTVCGGASATWRISPRRGVCHAAAAAGARGAAAAVLGRLRTAAGVVLAEDLPNGADNDFASPLITFAAKGALGTLPKSIAGSLRAEVRAAAAALGAGGGGTELRAAAAAARQSMADELARRPSDALAGCARVWAQGGDPLSLLCGPGEEEVAAAARHAAAALAAAPPDFVLLLQPLAGGDVAHARSVVSSARRILQRQRGRPPPQPPPRQLRTFARSLPPPLPAAAARAVAAATGDEPLAASAAWRLPAREAYALPLLAAAAAARGGQPDRCCPVEWHYAATDDGGCAFALTQSCPAEARPAVCRRLGAAAASLFAIPPSAAEATAAARAALARSEAVAAQSPHWATAASAAAGLAAAGRAPCQVAPAALFAPPSATLRRAAAGCPRAAADVRNIIARAAEAAACSGKRDGSAPGAPAAGTVPQHTRSAATGEVGSAGAALPHTVRADDPGEWAALLLACQLLSAQLHHHARAGRGAYGAAAAPVADAVWMWSARDPTPARSASEMLAAAQVLRPEGLSPAHLALLKVSALRQLLPGTEPSVAACAAAATHPALRRRVAARLSTCTTDDVARVWREHVVPQLPHAATAVGP